MAAMSPLLKIKQAKKNKFYFFHHGLGSLNPIVFQKITSFYLKKLDNLFCCFYQQKTLSYIRMIVVKIKPHSCFFLDTNLKRGNKIVICF